MKVLSIRRPRLAGFTLIELLIVVAIIGILAAIALPNFLEAQTRARLARVQGEFHSLATAIEAYCVDHSTYPWFDEYNFPPRYNEISYRLIPLTTPQEYMSTVSFHDPFIKVGTDSYNDGFLRYHYNYRNHEYWSSSSAPGDTYPVWVLNSIGPDMVANHGLLTEMWARGLVAPDYVIVYDPSNGTISDGDIPRTGGSTKFRNW